MSGALGDVLVAAVAVALSPVPVIAVVLVVGSPRGRTSGPAFAVGWVVGLSVVAVAVTLLAAGADDPDGGSARALAIARIVVGVGFLALAVRKWTREGTDDPAPPAWMGTVGSVGPGKALSLGLATSAANPKNLALTATAVGAVAESGAASGTTAATLAVFVVVASTTVVGAVVAQLLAPERSAAPLASVQRFMTDHERPITVVVLLLLGAKLLGDGLAGL